MAEALARLTGKNTYWTWVWEQQEALKQLQVALITPPVMQHPNLTRNFEVHTDASATATGAALSQLKSAYQEHDVDMTNVNKCHLGSATGVSIRPVAYLA